MRQEHSVVHIVLKRRFVSAVWAITALLLIANATWADEGNNRAIQLLKIIPVPVSSANTTAGAMYSFDISWVDQARQLYFLADRSNKAVDVVDAKTGTFVKQIAPTAPFAPFAGFKACSPPAGANDCAGPDGVVTAEAPLPWLFVTDAPSRLLCFNFVTGATISEIRTSPTEPTRADELAYDPEHGLILAINNAATPPFGTLIRVNKGTCGLTFVAHIPFDAAHGVDAQNGAEQPVWVPEAGKFFLSIPQIGPNVRHGGVVSITTAGVVDATFGVDFCQPAGLTVGPRHKLFIGCNTTFDTAGNIWSPTGTVTAAPKDVVLDIRSGATTDVLGVGAGDEVWFNRGDGNYYATGSGSPFRPLPAATAQGSTPLGVVRSSDNKIVEQLTTFNVPAGVGHPAGTSHSVAANAANNHIFVPLPANNAFSAFAVPGGGPVPDCEKGCIAVFGRPGDPDEDRAERDED